MESRIRVRHSESLAVVPGVLGHSRDARARQEANESARGRRCTGPCFLRPIKTPTETGAGVRRQQRHTEKQVRTVRTTLRSLQKVEL